MGIKTFFRSITVSALLCEIGAALHDGAAIKLKLNHKLSEMFVSSEDCLDGDAFPLHDAAIVFSEGGTNGTISDVPVTWDAESKTFTTSDGESMFIDEMAVPYHTFTTRNHLGATCVYDMTVLASGESMRITGEGTVTEKGLWQFAEFVDVPVDTAGCEAFAATDRAYVAYSTVDAPTSRVNFGSWDGYVDPQFVANLTAHSAPDTWCSLSVDATGALYFSTQSGCGYGVVVTDGSVMGVTPSSPSSHSSSFASSTSSLSSTRVSGGNSGGDSVGSGGSNRKLRPAVAHSSTRRG